MSSPSSLPCPYQGSEDLQDMLNQLSQALAVLATDEDSIRRSSDQNFDYSCLYLLPDTEIIDIPEDRVQHLASGLRKKLASLHGRDFLDTQFVLAVASEWPRLTYRLRTAVYQRLDFLYLHCVRSPDPPGPVQQPKTYRWQRNHSHTARWHKVSAKGPPLTRRGRLGHVTGRPRAPGRVIIAVIDSTADCPFSLCGGANKLPLLSKLKPTHNYKLASPSYPAIKSSGARCNGTSML
ncbi:hypothetical protein J6590_039268 [Homalodisca vitripennis]|nr:hypothetical protein J6590_039268 [Homalodisca vitripennis]